MKIKAIYLYLFFVAWTIFLTILLKLIHLNVTGLGTTLTFLTIIFLPGILLGRIVTRLGNNLAVKLLLTIGLGFGYYFFLNFLSIIIGLTLVQLEYISFIGVILIFIIAFWKDFKVVWEPNFNWFKNQEIGDYILYVFLLLSALLAFLALDAQSDKLIGDGWFHLAILQKITSGNGLNPYNLLLTKGASLNPVYSFPLWHILVGELSAILNVSIFTALKQALLPLSIVAMIVWYSFMMVIFRNKYLAITIFLSFILIFLKDNYFYYLVALASPDSFNRLLLMPLILGLSINFFFGKTNSKILNVFLIALLTVFMGLIHFTQLIYFVLILIFLFIILIIFKKREEFLKTLMVLGGLAVLTVPYLLIFHRQTLAGFLSGNVQTETENLTFKTYLGANIIYRYAILSLPIIILFAKKNSRLFFLVATAVAMLFIYWPYLGLQSFFLKYLGDIFVSRAIANIPHFIYFGFLIFLVVWGASFVLTKNKTVNFIAMIILGVLAIVGLIFPDFYSGFVQRYIFSETFSLFTIGFWILFVLAAAIGIIYFFKKQEFSISEPENKLGFSLLLIFLTVFLATPYFLGIKKVFAQNPNGTIISNRLTTNASDTTYLGGAQAIDFLGSIKRKVFITDNVTLAQMILLYSDNYVAEYPYSIKEFIQSNKFYNDNLGLRERLAILDTLKVDMIVVRHLEELPFYENNRQYFTQVYQKSYFYKDKERYLIIYEYRKQTN